MKKLWMTLLLPVFAGCLSAHVPPVASWNVVADAPGGRSSGTPAFGVARLAQVTVCPPYDDRQLAVYRSDNTLAFDAYNLFSALPSRLLCEPTRRLLDASGKFRRVVGPTSSATVTHVVELTVTDFRLDCSTDENEQGRRVAVAEVYALVLDKDRNPVASSRGVSRADAADGNYGVAFSKAFSGALNAAVAEF